MAGPAFTHRLRLRCRRALTAVRLLARGGLRYARKAPRLYAAAGEQRQVLRADLGNVALLRGSCASPPRPRTSTRC
jgi:hypothetical protein